MKKRFEGWFETIARISYNNPIKIIIVFLLLVVMLASQLPKMTKDTSNEGYLRKDDQTLLEYNEFRNDFGRGVRIVALIESDHIFKDRFLTKLKSLHDEITEKVPFIKDVTSLINARDTRGEGDALIVEDLLKQWPDTPAAFEKIKNRSRENKLYQNTLLSKDGRYTAILIELQTYSSVEANTDVMESFDDDSAENTTSEKQIQVQPYLTSKEVSQAVEAVYSIIKKYDTPDFKIELSGASTLVHVIGQWMTRDMTLFVSLAFVMIIIFLYVMFRRVSAIFLALLIVNLSILSTFGLMAFFGKPLTVPTTILPTFLLAVGICDSVHILALFYHNYRGKISKEVAIIGVFRHSGLAITMTSFTTAAGLFSFITSNVDPIRMLGVFAGIGVILALIYTIFLIPAILALIPVKPAKDKEEIQKQTFIDKLLNGAAELSIQKPVLILSVSAILIIISIYAIPKIKFSHDVLRWLPEDSEVRLATEKLDKVMRGTYTLEVVIDFKKENALYDPKVLNRIEKSIEYIDTLENGIVFAGKSWAITTIIKEINKALNENQEKFYVIPQDKNLIAQEFMLFENSGSDDLEEFTDSQFSKARFIVKLPFVDAIAYQAFITEVKKHFNDGYPDAAINVTGVTLYTRTMSNAIVSLKESYLIAIAVITFLMILFIGHLRTGIISMIPNLAPIIIMLGIMGWFKLPMNLFTLLVGSIAIGLVVDDTIHFMYNFRKYFEETGTPEEAIRKTLQTTGRALLVTSCVLSIGFFIFMFASMSNFIVFGFLTGITIVLALAADLLLAPALMMIVNKKSIKDAI